MKVLLYIIGYVVGVALSATLARFIFPKGNADAQGLFAFAWPLTLPVSFVLAIIGLAIVAGRALADLPLRRWPEDSR